MSASKDGVTLPEPGSRDQLAGLLGPGVVTLGPGECVRFADPRALELLGCADGAELERVWEQLKSRLESAGLSWNGGNGDGRLAALDHLVFDFRRDPAEGGVLLVQDLETLTGLENDLRLTSQMRSVAQISPAVAHDLRAPINAMVFAIEILRETIASGRAADPANREKMLQRVGVLNEELQRLHRGLETFLAFISPRSDKIEPLDLRDLAGELASLLVAPARKQQVQVKAELPEEPVPAEGSRFLLRQALLHLALAALAGVPKQGVLHVDLERLDGRALLRVYGDAETEGPAPDVPAPGFDLSFSAEGALAQLWVARSILAAHGGEARVAGAEGSAAGAPRVYEVEFMISATPGPAREGMR